MGKQFDSLDDAHIKFIDAQHIFFSGSAAKTGKVNVSPKGMDCLRVLSPNRIIWRNMTGSGNETTAHIADTPRMTLMWCSFEKRPQIMRTYGTARTIHRADEEWAELDAHFETDPAARQIFDLSIQMVQTSCGYAVPLMEFTSERDTLKRWATDKGEDAFSDYWADRNATTLDGVPTLTAEKNLGTS